MQPSTVRRPTPHFVWVALAVGALSAAACADQPSSAGDGRVQAADLGAADATMGGPDVERADAAPHPDADAGELAPADADVQPPDAGPAADAAGAVDAGPPAGLTWWSVGSSADFVPAVPAVGGAILMGGGADVDEAYRWAAQRVGGDVVVLRASGADGYQDYLYREIGGFDSVETLRVDTRALAEDAWVADRVRHAELVYMAGGDQGRYVDAWTGTRLAAAVEEARRSGAILGGTSAGQMILGGVVFAARQGSITSAEALRDPFDPALDLVPSVFALPSAQGFVLDTHFGARDRFGRLLVFLARARAAQPAITYGLGVDEATAVLVEPDGSGRVVGSGAAYVVRLTREATLVAGRPVDGLAAEYRAVLAGEALSLATPLGAMPPSVAVIRAGVLDPADPYAP
jgi:cyanophycinase